MYKFPILNSKLTLAVSSLHSFSCFSSIANVEPACNFWVKLTQTVKETIIENINFLINGYSS
jgi:hypothetical protein